MDDKNNISPLGSLMGGPEWLLTEQDSPEERTEIDPDTGGIIYKKIRPLVLQEELFVREYCKTYDVKKTAEKLSMKTSIIHGFLARKPVQVAVRNRALAMAKSADMDASWTLQNIREVVERCMGDSSDPNAKFDPSNALRGLELVGKSLQLFSDKSEANTNNRTVIRIESNVGQIGQTITIGSDSNHTGVIGSDAEVIEVING